jgi:hypothetical protein
MKSEKRLRVAHEARPQGSLEIPGMVQVEAKSNNGSPARVNWATYYSSDQDRKDT